MDRIFCLLLSAALLIAGCTPRSGTPTPTDTARAPSQTPVMTPTLAAALTVPQLVEGARGREQIIGLLRNQSSAAITEVELRVSVWTKQDGQLLQESTIAPLLPYLAPGASSPFVVPYQLARAAGHVEAEIRDYRPWQGQAADVVASIESERITPQGEIMVLGYLQTPADRPVSIDGFTLARTAADAAPSALASATVFPHYLLPSARVPFQAVLPHGEGRTHVYAAASLSERRSPSALRVRWQPGWQTDPQGNRFLLGTLINEGDEPTAAHVLLIIREQGVLARVLSLESPIPLAPGERRPFAVDDPPQHDAPEASAQGLDAIVQPLRGDAEAALPLEVQVTSFEYLSSRTFLRGRVQAPEGAAVTVPTLFVALRGTDGTLWSAGWHALGAELDAGATSEFSLTLPLPAAIDLAQAEYDVRALGLPAD